MITYHETIFSPERLRIKDFNYDKVGEHYKDYERKLLANLKYIKGINDDELADNICNIYTDYINNNITRDFVIIKDSISIIMKESLFRILFENKDEDTIRIFKGKAS